VVPGGVVQCRRGGVAKAVVCGISPRAGILRNPCLEIRPEGEFV
jgi:hypothetical protein